MIYLGDILLEIFVYVVWIILKVFVKIFKVILKKGRFGVHILEPYQGKYFFMFFRLLLNYLSRFLK